MAQLHRGHLTGKRSGSDMRSASNSLNHFKIKEQCAFHGFPTIHED